MEVLDTSIANVALTVYRRRSRRQQRSEYLGTHVVPGIERHRSSDQRMAGGLFGRKRFFLLCIVLFTVSSLLCGVGPKPGAANPVSVPCREQAAGDSSRWPKRFSPTRFPPQKRGLAFAVYGITAVMAPTIGPTLGGWITDNYSWRWIFYINLPIGILALFLVSRLVEDPPYLRRTSGRRGPPGLYRLAFLALGVGAFQVVLDKGQEDDWFGSRFILTLSVIAAICLISLVAWEWLHEKPMMDLRLFKNFNFAMANLMMFMLGVVYFSSLVMMPQFLQTLMGYTAELAGLVLSASGIVAAGASHADRGAA